MGDISFQVEFPRSYVSERSKYMEILTWYIYDWNEYMMLEAMVVVKESTFTYRRSQLLFRFLFTPSVSSEWHNQNSVPVTFRSITLSIYFTYIHIYFVFATYLYNLRISQIHPYIYLSHDGSAIWMLWLYILWCLGALMEVIYFNEMHVKGSPL